jgi:tRNA A-37 threonylcarbamoyl transferase component Bud32
MAESPAERWSGLERIIDQALDLAPDLRLSFVQQSCSGDPSLRVDAEQLLRATEAAEFFLDQPAPAYAAPLVARVTEGQPLAPGTTLGPYEVVRRLGRGGTATVYLARDTRHHRSVAIKVLHPELAAALGSERFLREIEIAASLHHPHILPLFDSGASDGLLYYVMPLVEGESLRRRLEQAEPLTTAEAIAIAQQVAAALDHAHRQGVVHRDIKPENILLQDGQAIVADFGIARAIDTAGVDRLSEPGFATGTPTYMSPEQAKGEGPLDGRSDIYSLGCVLYEMLTGQPPFTGPTPRLILARHSTEPVTSLRTLVPTIPKAVDHAVLKALAKRRADRFATAGEFVRALVEGSAVSTPHRGRRFLTSAVLIGTIISAALALLFASSLTRGRSAGGPPDPRLVAILPFRTSGAVPDLSWLHEGMADLLAVKLEREPELRAVDPMFVMDRWERMAGSAGGRITLEAAAMIAAGATRLSHGSRRLPQGAPSQGIQCLPGGYPPRFHLHARGGGARARVEVGRSERRRGSARDPTGVGRS